MPPYNPSGGSICKQPFTNDPLGYAKLEEHRKVDHRKGQRTEDTAQAAFRIVKEATEKH